MPPRKEPKETVTYPPSKRKPLPFKPHRPPKLARTSTEGSEGLSASRPDATRDVEDLSSDENDALLTAPSTHRNAQSTRAATLHDDEDPTDDDSSDGLPDDPAMAVRAAARQVTAKQPQTQTTNPRRTTGAEQELLPETSDADIPQPLLLRLMHEHFKSNDTKIDKHAAKLVQRYVEIFLRESVARAALSQKDEVDSGVASQSDRGWLDSKDLEKVAGGLVLDF